MKHSASEKKSPLIRLQKFMADCGIASRRESEEIIAMGRVSVNGSTVKVMGTTIDPKRDFVKVDGKPLRVSTGERHYYVFNKPRNVVTTLKDPQGRPTISDYFIDKPQELRIYPIGRLDFDVSGCLLLTDDGDLAHRMMHPKFHVPRVYEVKVSGAPGETTIAKMKRRVPDCRIERMRGKAENSWYRLTLHEGKYHQVKRMWMEAGHPVIKMSRISYGGVDCGVLRPGEIRPLSPDERRKLFKLCGLDEVAKEAAANKSRAGDSKEIYQSKPAATRPTPRTMTPGRAPQRRFVRTQPPKSGRKKPSARPRRSA